MVGEAIVDLLSPVTDNVSPMMIPQNKDLPWVVYRIVSDIPVNDKDGSGDLHQIRVQIDSFHTDYSLCDSLAKEIKSELTYYSGTSKEEEIVNIYFDSEADLSELEPEGTYRRTQDYIFWVRDQDRVSGLLNFDGTDDMVDLTGFPAASITAPTKIITFNLYLHKDPTADECVMSLIGTQYDWFCFQLDHSNNDFVLHIGNLLDDPVYSFPSPYLETVLEMEIAKAGPVISYFKINGVNASYGGVVPAVHNVSTLSSIGCRYNNSSKELFFDSGYVWNIKIDGLHWWKGIGKGNADLGWIDNTGAIDGTVSGSPTMIDLIL